MKKIIGKSVSLLITFLSSFVLAQNNVLELDGNTSYLDLSSHSQNLIFDSPFTIEFWFKANFDHKSDNGTLWSISDGNSSGFGERFEIRYGESTSLVTDERISVILAKGLTTTAFTFSDAGNYTSEWHHYAVTGNGTSWELFIDGVSQTLTQVPFSPTNFYGDYGEGFSPKSHTNVGIRQLSSLDNETDGSFDEVRIWNTNLSQTEINSNKNATLLGNETNLFGYWNFDNVTAEDLTANSFDGTLVGNANIAFDSTLDFGPGFDLISPVQGDTVSTLNIFFNWEDAPIDSFTTGNGQILYTLQVAFDSSFATGSGGNFLVADSLTVSEYETDYITTIQTVLAYIDTLIDTNTTTSAQKYSNSLSAYEYPAFPLYWRVFAYDDTDTLFSNQTEQFTYKLGSFSLLAPMDSTNYQTAPDSINFVWEEAGSPITTIYFMFLTKSLDFDNYELFPSILDNVASPTPNVTFTYAESDTLTDGKYNWFTIAVLTNGGDTEVLLSKEILFFSVGDTTTQVPLGQIGNVAISVENGQATLSWNSVVGANGYNFYKSVMPNSVFDPLNLVSTVTDTFLTVDVSALNSSYFVITAKD